MSREIEEKNHYDLLGLKQEATTEEVKRAYKDIARVFHPDSNYYDEIVQIKTSESDMEAFKLMTAAYNTLVDAKKRADYDKSLETKKTGGSNSSFGGTQHGSNGGATDWPYSSRQSSSEFQDRRNGAYSQFFGDMSQDASRSNDPRYNSSNRESGFRERQSTGSMGGSSVLEMLQDKKRKQRKVVLLSVSLGAVLLLSLAAVVILANV